MKRLLILLILMLLFCGINISQATIPVNFRTPTKTGNTYTFPSLTVAGSSGEKGFLVHIRSVVEQFFPVFMTGSKFGRNMYIRIK